MINVVIPMAGSGKRFLDCGYDKPKPFIDVKGKPMIVRVLENLAYKGARYILLSKKDHVEKEQKTIEKIKKNFNVKIISIDKMTEGAACTLLFARKYINDSIPLLIANSDQIIGINIADFIDDSKSRGLDGSILTFIDKFEDPKWSFAQLDKNNLVSEVREKSVISKYATVGIYLFSKGKDFVNASLDMIIHNDRVNNEFYTCPAFNYAIKEGLKIGSYNIDYNQMHGIGTPEDLNIYLKKL